MSVRDRWRGDKVVGGVSFVAPRASQGHRFSGRVLEKTIKGFSGHQMVGTDASTYAAPGWRFDGNS